MAIDLIEIGVRVFVSPKSGSTSVKALAYKLDNGYPLDRTDLRIPLRLHKAYPNEQFRPALLAGGQVCLAVWRNPILRFVSLYQSKVLSPDGFIAKQWEKARHRGISKPATLDAFVSNLDLFTHAVPGLGRHARPQTDWLGYEPEAFTACFSLDCLSRLGDFLSDLSGLPVSLDHRNKSLLSEASQLSSESRERLKHIYWDDFVFGATAGLS